MLESSLKIFFSRNNTFLTLVTQDQHVDLSEQLISTSKKNSTNTRFNQRLNNKNHWTTKNLSLSNISSRTSGSLTPTSSRFKNREVGKQKVVFSRVDQNYRVLLTLSAGLCGARNSKKGSLVDPLINSFVTKTPIRSFKVEVRGFSPIRESFLNSLVATQNLQITSLIDKTAIPHNGCRRPNKRRL